MVRGFLGFRVWRCLLIICTSFVLKKQCLQVPEFRSFSAVLAISIDTATYLTFCVIFAALNGNSVDPVVVLTNYYMLIVASLTNLTLMATNGQRVLSFLVFSIINVFLVALSIPLIMSIPKPSDDKIFYKFRGWFLDVIIQNHLPELLFLTIGFVLSVRTLVKRWYHTWKALNNMNNNNCDL